MKLSSTSKANILSKILSLLFSLLSLRKKKVQINFHNDENIFDYPEDNWNFVPFPDQKGIPFNADNLSTVNRHSFIEDENFKQSLRVAESRWQSSGFSRNIAWRLKVFLWAFGLNLNHKSKQESVFIECGTGKGYMAAGACDYFKFDNKDLPFYLIDLFQDSLDSDYETKKETKSFNTYDAYTSNVEEVKNFFKKYTSVRIIKGKIPNAFDEIKINQILFVHIDLNDHVAEKLALDYLIKYFIDGTVILFDDYGGPGGQEQAKIHEDFAKANNKELLIMPTGQALIIW